MTLLEPGCGRCEFLKGFKKLKMNVRGTDISEESKDFVKDIEIQLCDMDKENLPYKDHTFDVVFSKSFIEHLHDPKKYISESMRVLKKGGLLITLTPDWESNYKKFYDDFTHRSPFTTISLKDVYELNNFKDVNTFKFRQLPIVWKYPLLNYFCSFISIFIPVRVTNKFFKMVKRTHAYWGG